MVSRPEIVTYRSQYGGCFSHKFFALTFSTGSTTKLTCRGRCKGFLSPRSQYGGFG